MKIAWFTPLAKNSSIGRFSAAVAGSLANFAEVELCHFDVGDVRGVPTPVRAFRSAESISLRVLSTYDLLVYNFGNYLRFHREIFELSKRWPGVCILHDVVMHHFFAEYYFDHRRDPDGYTSLMERRYGEGAPGPEARIWQTEQVAAYPLFEEVTPGALGIITHSQFFRARAAQCFAGPVAHIPLACYAVRPKPRACRSELGIHDDQVLIVTVGHVNANKCIDCAIEAIGSLASTTPGLVYAVVGQAPADYLRKLRLAASNLGIGDAVRFAGEVSDDLLCTYLSAADICVNLRFPSTEGASGSAIEAMLFGRPVVVTDTGFFSELPDDCVMKTRPNNVADVQNAIARLARDPGAREALGTRARLFAEAEFNSDVYARRALEFFWEVRNAKPMLDLADRVAVELRKMGVHMHQPIVDSVAGEMARIFSSDEDSPVNANPNPRSP